ncbi:MAG: hypothetical protein HQK49_04905 [Oligoflexia bacterium]|nr:hypothetical protein [Oligoflexia bacterium]
MNFKFFLVVKLILFTNFLLLGSIALSSEEKDNKKYLELSKVEKIELGQRVRSAGKLLVGCRHKKGEHSHDGWSTLDFAIIKGEKNEICSDFKFLPEIALELDLIGKINCVFLEDCCPLDGCLNCANDSIEVPKDSENKTKANLDKGKAKLGIKMSKCISSILSKDGYFVVNTCTPSNIPGVSNLMQKLENMQELDLLNKVKFFIANEKLFPGYYTISKRVKSLSADQLQKVISFYQKATSHVIMGDEEFFNEGVKKVVHEKAENSLKSGDKSGDLSDRICEEIYDYYFGVVTYKFIEQNEEIKVISFIDRTLVMKKNGK